MVVKTLMGIIVSILVRFQFGSYEEYTRLLQESYSVYSYKISFLFVRGILQASYKNPTVSIVIRFFSIRFQFSSYAKSYKNLIFPKGFL